MRPIQRFLVATAVLVFGGVGAPFLTLPSQHFSWQLFAQVYEADIEVVKTNDAPAAVRQGDFFSYTIVVTNNGPADATNVVVDDTLPDSVGYVSDTCGGTYLPAIHSWTWQVGALAVDGQVSCGITVQVATSANGPIMNTVTANGDQPDPTPGNNSSSSTALAEPLPIPALSPFGLLVFIASVAVLAVLMLRRRGPPL